MRASLLARSLQTRPGERSATLAFRAHIGSGLEYPQHLDDLLGDLPAQTNLRGVVQPYRLARLRVVDGPATALVSDVVFSRLIVGIHGRLLPRAGLRRRQLQQHGRVKGRS